jgi:pyruvate formate lyase activating enzyme
MIIGGMEKLTLLDYPDKVAAIIFTAGCNYKCPFCQNSSLVYSNSIIKENEIFDYLEKRKKILDGVCVSGGEPLVQKDIKLFIKRIKDMGFLVKLDTNGSFPDKLKELLDEKLIDYVAMDIKNEFDNYSKTVGMKNVDIENIKKSIKLLEESDIDYEFRTTIIKQFHNIDNILKICKYIGKNSKYYLQNFVDSPDVPQRGLTGFSKEELTNILSEVNKKYSNVQIRYI